jgi:hypothetical protein
LVTVAIADETDQIVIFKGFSSSLMRPTAVDPDVPVIPEDATIVAIDRLRSPYLPDNPDYLERNLTWDEMQTRLSALGL